MSDTPVIVTGLSQVADGLFEAQLEVNRAIWDRLCDEVTPISPRALFKVAYCMGVMDGIRAYQSGGIKPVGRG